jgi:RNA polymerase sigma factor (sigma-70 family)
LSHQAAPDSLSTESRRLRDLFNEVVEPHRADLWRYCRALAKSPWDGEDLFQETLLKAFAMLPQLWSPIVPKTYLFRIATNTWIDHCRKHGVHLDPLEEEHVPAIVATSRIEIREAIENLVSHLPPRQLVIFFLMDVFDFSAREVASMVRCTEGAAYAAVQRARQRIKAINAELRCGQSANAAVGSDIVREAKVNQVVVEKIIHALNTGDIHEFLGALSEHIHNDAAPEFQEFSKQEVRSNSGQGLPSGLHASYKNLWGRDVILVLAETEAGHAIHNIIHPVNAGEELVYMRSYYFCKEFLLEAGRVLGIPVQTKKPAVDWT